jgi:hypothetical protein
MNKYEEEAKKRRTTNVYSNTYDNNDWSERDALPTKDPIGDTDEYVEGYDGWKEGQKAYEEAVKGRLLKPEGKIFGAFTKPESCCSNPENHKEVPLVYSVCKICKVCGADLGVR